MKLFASLLATSSLAQTDCNAVRRYLYPDTDDCPNEMKCSGDYACSIDKDTCDSYKCVAASLCPDGTSYSVFSPQESAKAGSRKHLINRVNGYFCDPIGLTCAYDSVGLYIDAVVDNKKPWIDAPVDDDVKRKVTLISKTKHDKYEPGTIFKQFHQSKCVGEVIADGTKVRFRKYVNDPDCKDEFDHSQLISETNGLTYIVDFYIGFDDYWFVNEFNEERILRGGVSNQFQCRLKASDHDWIDPNPDSDRGYDYIEYQGQVPFIFTSYVDQEFSIEYDGGVIQLDDVFQNNGLFVEAKHEAGDALESHIMHFRECTSNNYRKIDEDNNGNPIYESFPSTTFAFLNDGCIDNEIITYKQQSSRTEWTSNVRTFVKDQFNLKVSASDENGSQIKYSCEMVLCPLDVFGDSVSGSPCHLSDKCANRYDNLFSTRPARATSSKKPDALIKTLHYEGSFIVNGSGRGSFALGLALASILLFNL